MDSACALLLASAAWAVASAVASPAAGQAPPSCAPPPAGTPSARSVLDRAMRAMGVPDDASVLHFGSAGRTVQNFQSDRTYPPFFSAMQTGETWYDPATRAERARIAWLYPRGGAPASTTITDARSVWVEQQGELREVPGFDRFSRPQRDMNPWAVVGDWVAAADAHVVGLCPYRDDDRLVLERSAPGRPAERLYFDRESGFPVKLDRTVPHETWGQFHEEVLWSTWIEAGEGFLPSAAFRIRDGDVDMERTVGEVELLPAADAALPALPAEVRGPAPTSVLGDPAAMRPDTVRIGDGAFLLAHPMYNEAILAAGDTVWVLDATLNEARARQDSAWVARLFPDARHVAVVVTDLAWPHVGGVRFWVARGATIVSHAQSEAFLRRLVERRWTLEPDRLERKRARSDVPFRFVGIDGGADVAGGRLAIRHIAGLSSEGALMALDRGTGFLWAGDWIQMTDRPSMYAAEVVRAVEREGFEPVRAGAEHIAITAWDTLAALNPERR
jgi:hypothetical protein